jgi:hypothetical protein
MKELMEALMKKYKTTNVELHVDVDGFVQVAKWNYNCREYEYLDSYDSLSKLKNDIGFHKNI